MIVLSPFVWSILLRHLCSAGYTPQEQQQQQEEEFIVSDATLPFRKQLRYTVCTNVRDACPEWAAQGECHTNPAYMGPHCPVSCHTCALLQPRLVTTPFSHAAVIPQATRQASGWEFPDAIGRDLGVPQIVYDRTHHHRIAARIAEARRFLRRSDDNDDVFQSCQNHNVNCTMWAVQGECELNPEYMKQSCAPVCWACSPRSESITMDLKIAPYK